MIYLVFASYKVRLIDCPIGDPFLGEDCQDALSAYRILGTDYINHIVRFLHKAAFLFLVWKISAKVICSVFVDIPILVGEVALLRAPLRTLRQL
jgi:hypothetical protein